jgi:transcriptional regulator of heat shock response
MTDALTARQTQILKALIEEYIFTAEPVGSEALEKKYSLGVSPATIRNEMYALTKSGFLRQPHTSAGRTPAPKAMKFYIDQLMEEKQMSLTDEVKAKEEVWDARDDLNELMDEMTQSLAERTKSLAVASLENGKVWHAGFANIFLNPDFSDLQMSANLFTFIEETKRLQELFFERMTGESPIEVLFGEDLDWPDLNYIGICGTRFHIQGREGALGVFGPARLRYPTVIPVLRYFRQLMEEISTR